MFDIFEDVGVEETSVLYIESIIRIVIISILLTGTPSILLFFGSKWLYRKIEMVSTWKRCVKYLSDIEMELCYGKSEKVWDFMFLRNLI